MKIVTFSVPSPVGRLTRLGACLDDAATLIVDLNSTYADHLAQSGSETRPIEAAAFRMPADMLTWLDGGVMSRQAAELALAHARARCANEKKPLGFNEAQLVFPRTDVKLLAPLPRPRSFREFSCYENHLSKSTPAGQRHRRNADWYRYPMYYKGNAASIAGPEDPMPFPYYTEKLDPEFEIGIIIGRQGRNLTLEQARECIAGYTILVDTSGRGLRSREVLGPCKDKDFHTAIGPCMVTADEIDPTRLAVRLAVDGETWWSGNTGDFLGWTPEALVAYISDNETVYPGDIFGTGTIGNSASLDTDRWVQPGQTMRFEAEGIGAMDLMVVPGEHVVDYVKSGISCLIDPSK